MTKKELAEKIKQFIASEPDDYDDEWYMSPRDMAGHVMERFAEFAKIDLGEVSK